MTPKEALAQAKAATKAGDLPRAIVLYEQVLARAPKHSEAGKALRKLRKQAAAPRQPVTMAELQTLQNLIAQGDIKRAKPQLTDLLRRAPNAPFLHLQNGLIHAGAGQLANAVAAFKRALELDPKYSDARNNLAIALGALGRFHEAVELCEISLKSDPKNVLVWLSYAENLLQIGRGEDADSAAQKAIELAPDFAQAWVSRGHVLTSRGQKDQAVACFEKAIECDPDFIAAQVELVRQLGRKTPALRAQNLKKILTGKALNTMDKAAIHFALADMYDGQSNVATAFDHYAQGNQFRQQENPYDHGQEVRQFEAVKRTFSKGKMARIKTGAADVPRPVFIVGMNRSGTSLVEQILAGHSEIFGAGELDLVDQFAAPFAGRLDSASAHELTEFRNRYLTALANRSDRPVVTDKMPINYRWIGLILHLFPNAQIIYLDRLPRDVCFSNFKASFGSTGHAYCYDMISLARNYAHHREVMAFWNSAFGTSIKTVRYESLIESPEQGAKMLLEWLNLDWQPDVMQFHKLDRTVRTLSQGQVHQGIYTSSIGRWQPYADFLTPMFEELERLGIAE